MQAFQVNLWNNIRGQNRCGQCHNATTPAQMPNFARSDNVNLAYAEANTVVNLAQPSTSDMVVKVSGGHNCWLADPSACGQILTTWISNWANATGATSATTVTLVAPPDQSVGQSLSFSSATTAATDYGNTIYTLTSVYCSKCHSSQANPATQQAPYFADPNITTAYQAAIPKIDFTGCLPQNSRDFRDDLRRQLALLPASGDRHAQLLEHLLGRCGAHAGANPGVCHGCDSRPTWIRHWS